MLPGLPVGVGSGEGRTAEASAAGLPTAEACFELQVKSLAGEHLATLPDARGAWREADVVGRLPELLPGHKYELVYGETPVRGEIPLGELSHTPHGEGMCLSAVVTKKPDGQLDMDLALIEAADKLDAKRIDTLLSAGADAAFVHNPPGTWGAEDSKSALHMAIQSGCQALRSAPPELDSFKLVLESLLNARADVNAQRRESDWRGCGFAATAFGMALPIAMRDPAVLALLLAAGADADTKFDQETHSMRTDGRSVRYVLHTAVQQAGLEVVQTLLVARASVDAVHSEKFDNERGFNRDMQQTSMHLACYAQNSGLAALLLEHGADANFVRRELVHDRRTPSRPPVTDDPRKQGFEPTVDCVPVEETALHIAIQKGDAGLVALLLRAGADAQIMFKRGKSQRSPQDLCASNEELLQALRAGGAAQPCLEGPPPGR